MIITHATPTYRRITEELTFLNDSSSSVEILVLHGYRYRPGMEITDDDDTHLSFLTNEVVKSILSTSNNPDDKNLLEDINSRRKYVQVIFLPDSKPIPVGKTRVIRISYTDAGAPARHLNSLTKWLFNIPEYDVEKNTPSSERFPTQITITPPENFRVRIEEHLADVTETGSSRRRSLKEEDHYHLTVSDNIMDASIPHLDEGTVRFRLRYGIYPESNEQNLLTTFILALLFLSVFLLLAVQGSLFVGVPVLSLFAQKLKAQVVNVSTFIILIALAFMGFVTNPLTNRMKYWAIFPILFSTIALLLS